MLVRIQFVSFDQAKFFVNLSIKNSRVCDPVIKWFDGFYSVVFDFDSFEESNAVKRLFDADEDVIDIGVHPNFGLVGILKVLVSNKYLAYCLGSDEVIAIHRNDIYVIDSGIAERFDKLDLFINVSMRSLIYYFSDHNDMWDVVQSSGGVGERLRSEIHQLFGSAIDDHPERELVKFFGVLPRLHNLAQTGVFKSIAEKHFLDVEDGTLSPSNKTEILWRKYISYSMLKSALRTESDDYWSAIRLAKKSLALGCVEAWSYLEKEAFDGELVVLDKKDLDFRNYIDNQNYFLEQAISIESPYSVSDFREKFETISEEDRSFDFAKCFFSGDDESLDFVDSTNTSDNIILDQSQSLSTSYVLDRWEKKHVERLAFGIVNPDSGMERHFISVLKGCAMACTRQEIGWLKYLIEKQSDYREMVNYRNYLWEKAVVDSERILSRDWGGEDDSWCE